MSARASLRRFAVRGVFWREYLDWALRNVPFYLQPMLIAMTTVFFFFFAAPARRAIMSNLAVILPGSSRWANYLRAYRTLHNFAWSITDGAKFKLTKADFRYEIRGAEFLEQLGTGGGAIVLTAHMGNYDLGAAIFAQKFAREIRVVRAPESDTESEAHLRASLRQTGDGAVKIDYSTKGPLLSFDLLSAVRGGEIVSIQGDRGIPEAANAEGTLFGQPVMLPSGPFTLALVAQVPIYPLFFVRSGYRSYRIIAHPPIHVTRTTRSRDEDTQEAMARWRTILQETISEYWEQWFALVPTFTADAKR